MARYRWTIDVPEKMDQIMAWPIVMYRQIRYGYKFRRIKLTQGQYAKVSPCDYERIAKYKWRAQRTVRSYNALRIITVNGKPTAVYMHREILAPRDGFVVDHINNDGLDNRRENLRLATITENNQNRRGAFGKSSEFKGVRRVKKGKPWRAMITVNKKQMHLGSYDSEIAAAEAYNAAAKKYHGEFANLNKIEEK